jgi:hypothetical protein
MADPLVYENLDLLFRLVGHNGYEVLVTKAPGGTDVPVQAFEVPFDDRDFELFVLHLRGTKGRARGSLDSPETQRARDLGGDLYSALFKDKLAISLATSIERCQAKNHGLRLRLNLTNTPALLNLPWEFLYDASKKRFLSLFDETPIVRYLGVEYPVEDLRTPLPVRVLVMVSNPDDPNYEKLDVKQEKANLRSAVSALEKAGQLSLDFIPATLRDLTDALKKSPCHVFHFIGHGGFDVASGDGAILLEGDRRALVTSGQHLGTLLAGHTPLRLAVLNACEGARSAKDDPFAGVAQTLIQQGVPAVVAMQFEITDKAAIAFSEDFYSSLILGLPVDVAVSQARKAIYGMPNYTEWATPVLYMRSSDGVLFDLEAASTTSPKLTTPPKAQKSKWQKFAAERKTGDYVYGRITELSLDGAVVELGEDIEGHASRGDIHIYESTGIRRWIPKMKVGKMLWVEILKIDARRNVPISLAIPDIAFNDSRHPNRYQIGQKMEVTRQKHIKDEKEFRRRQLAMMQRVARTRAETDKSTWYE